jgi:hypothetical protein
MVKTSRAPARSRAAHATDTTERCLLGPQHLQDLLDQVAALGLGHPAIGREALSQRWRQAAAVYERLAVTEAGAADGAEILPLPKAMAGHIARLVELPGVRHTFDTVPVSFGMVELDKLVISQYSMTQAVVDRIIADHPLPLSSRRLALYAERRARVAAQLGTPAASPSCPPRPSARATATATSCTATTATSTTSPASPSPTPGW